MELFQSLSGSLLRHQSEAAFLINGVEFSYRELVGSVSDKKAWIQAMLPENEKVVGVMAIDDLHTYASILALWSEGKAYLPIAPDAPVDRNEAILKKAGVSTVLSSIASTRYSIGDPVRSDRFPTAQLDVSFKTCSDQDLAYLLFTSGTTGQPKGVPITRANLAAFIDAFHALEIPVDRGDRCLQMFELTFDLSVMSYLVPLLHGGCVCTVPKDVVKYGYIAELLEDARITLALMVPSIINYLRPYFDEIHCPELRHNLFCGEALPADITAEWSRCLPNARIINVYGPTEHTIFCTDYRYLRDGRNKEHNGILSIGKAMQGSALIVVDDDHRPVPTGEKGELCLSGPQLTPGYWDDQARTDQVMFVADHGGRPTRFYRTGDLCSMDDQGDILYVGRLDHQTKIQGYRVELGEIEHHAREFLSKNNVVALGVKNDVGNTEVALVIEGDAPDTKALIAHLRTQLPAYMVPTRVSQVPTFPLNANGKTDRNALLRSVTFAAP